MPVASLSVYAFQALTNLLSLSGSAGAGEFASRVKGESRKRRLFMESYGQWIKGQPKVTGWYMVSNSWNPEGCIYYVSVPVHECLEILRYKKVRSASLPDPL